MAATAPIDVTSIFSPYPSWEATDYGHSQGMTMEWLGLVPFFINKFDPRPAAQQIDDNYSHGGGWSPLDNGKWRFDPETGALTYDDPSDDPELYLPLATTELRDERLYFYDCAWLAIVQPDGSFEVSRLD